MVDRDIPQAPVFEYASPPESGPLPEGFHLKPKILRCPTADEIHSELQAFPEPERRDATLSKIPTALSQTLEAGKWRDAYELQRLGAEYDMAIDLPLQRTLGRALIEWGAAGFEALFTNPEKSRPEHVRGANIRDFCIFIDKHLERYEDEKPDWLELPVQRLSETIISYILVAPGHAEYELVSLFYPEPTTVPHNTPDSFLRATVRNHRQPDDLPTRFTDVTEGLISDRPQRALRTVALAFRAGLVEVEQVEEIFERVLQAVDVSKLVQSSANYDHTTFRYGDPRYHMEVDPTSLAHEVENIVPNAKVRANQVIGTRRFETVSQVVEQLEGTPGEWPELTKAVKTAEEMDRPVDPKIIKRMLDLCSFRAELGEEARGLPLGLRFNTIFDFHRNGHIEFEDLLSALTEIGDRYDEKSQKATQELNREDFNDNFEAEFYAEMELDLMAKTSIEYVITLARSLAQQVASNPEFTFGRLSELFDVQQLQGIVERYVKKHIDPVRKYITPERERLVRTYRNHDFKEPKREGELGAMKFKHPEKGPRNMIWQYPINNTAAAIVVDSLCEVIGRDSIRELSDWVNRYENYQIVAFIPSLLI